MMSPLRPGENDFVLIINEWDHIHALFVVTLTYIFPETRRVPTNDGADDLDQDEAELEGAGYRYAQHEGECSAQRR